MKRMIVTSVALAVLAACSSEPDANLPGNLQDERPFAGIAESEILRLNGTEPFWGGEIAQGIFTYTTPENIDGRRIPVTRFAGRGGLSFSGELEGEAVDIAVTPGACSDGMSDLTYPYTVTLQIGDEQRNGCASSDLQPVEGRE